MKCFNKNCFFSLAFVALVLFGCVVGSGSGVVAAAEIDSSTPGHVAEVEEATETTTKGVEVVESDSKTYLRPNSRRLCSQRPGDSCSLWEVWKCCEGSSFCTNGKCSTPLPKRGLWEECSVPGQGVGVGECGSGLSCVALTNDDIIEGHCLPTGLMDCIGDAIWGQAAMNLLVGERHNAWSTVKQFCSGTAPTMWEGALKLYQQKYNTCLEKHGVADKDLNLPIFTLGLDFSVSAGAGKSTEMGVAFHPVSGEYRCYTSTCTSAVFGADVGLGVVAGIDYSKTWNEFAGKENVIGLDAGVFGAEVSLNGGFSISSSIYGAGTFLTASYGECTTTVLNSPPTGTECTEYCFQEKTIYNGNWGDWKGWKGTFDKVDGSYACGAQIRFENSQGSGDDTAANGLKLTYCNINNWNQQHVTTIEGGLWGNWMPRVMCGRNSFIDGAQVRYEKKQGSGDDTALNGLKIHCRNRYTNKAEWKTVYNGRWGDWKGKVVKSNMFVKAANVRFERKQGSGDDTAWNGLKFMFLEPPEL